MSQHQQILNSLEKLPTGIAGLDYICHGGLPKNRTTLISGTAGTGKTVFSAQFLAEGIQKCDESGVFVTFEETPHDIRSNVSSFGWPIEQWEQEGKWRFVDASPAAGEPAVISGRYDLGALLTRIEHAVKEVGASRVAVDSLGAIFTLFNDRSTVRGEMLNITRALKLMGTTAILTSERPSVSGETSQFGVEEFVVDNVILLNNTSEQEIRRRTLEILKFRGTTHQKGEYPFTIMPEGGVVVIPLAAIELAQKSSDVIISSGVKELDKMCGGGFFRDSIILVSGATGTGKTLLATHFINGAMESNDRCLLLAFEESREQMFRNAKGWGIDFEKMEAEGKLKVICQYPEAMGIEDHLIACKEAIDEFNPSRIALDSLSALERGSTEKGFREFVIGLTSFIKQKQMTGLFTCTTPTLMGGASITERHISTLTDTIVLLRYVEMYGEMRRGLTVLKMRGSPHDKVIREYTIDQKGMHVGKQFRNVAGILAGNIVYLQPAAGIPQLGEMFKEEDIN